MSCEEGTKEMPLLPFEVNVVWTFRYHDEVLPAVTTVSRKPYDALADLVHVTQSSVPAGLALLHASSHSSLGKSLILIVTANIIPLLYSVIGIAKAAVYPSSPSLYHFILKFDTLRHCVFELSRIWLLPDQQD